MLKQTDMGGLTPISGYLKYSDMRGLTPISGYDKYTDMGGLTPIYQGMTKYRQQSWFKHRGCFKYPKLGRFECTI